MTEADKLAELSRLKALADDHYRNARRLAKLNATQAAEIERLSATVARHREHIKSLKAEMQRRDDNENRNCIRWGPCSRHNGRMSEMQ